MRVPVSIQPGDKTVKGHGAIVNLTISHDFGPKFLQTTYRNLVINDVIDLLAPVVHEQIRTGNAKQHYDDIQKFLTSPEADTLLKKKAGIPKLSKTYSWTAEEKKTANDLIGMADTERSDPTKQAVAQAAREALHAGERYSKRRDDVIKKTTNLIIPMGGVRGVSRTGSRTYAIAPSDVARVFVPEKILALAYDVQRAVDLGKSKQPETNKVRMTDVRTYLRHELESAYDLMEGHRRPETALLMDIPYIESLADQVAERMFEGPKGVRPDSPAELTSFSELYESFANRLPGNLVFRPIGVLSWAIAIEAGLLNRQLHKDMGEIKGDGYACPNNVEGMIFYATTPTPDAEIAFQQYVKARWPMITFALEPVIDQQNIEDSFTRRRDLQLAVSFALSAGRISFRQAIQFTRQLQYEAQTIALNQTVTSFAHGNDNFGWRFTPRYQTPPEESNGRAITNLLLRGGPGPNYQLNNSKIEPGLRELTAVVVMPSFVRSMRVDVASDWFRLHDPDERKLHSARTVELGRRINEARAALASACQGGQYRTEDSQRLLVKLHQLEAMLPLQTSFVKVPFENTLGGFALFTQGVTALVPELSGFEGVEYYGTKDNSETTDVLVYGSHLSIYETAVVVGGTSLPREGQGTFTVTDADAKTVVANSLTPLRDANGNLILLKPDGTTIPVKDTGSYDI